MARRELTEAEIDAKVAAAKDAAVVQWVNAALKEAIASQASAIRLKSGVSEPLFEFEVSDAWSERPAPPKGFMEGVLSRLKILAALDFAGKGSPDRGEFKLKVSGSVVTFSARLSLDDEGEEIVLAISREAEARPSEG